MACVSERQEQGAIIGLLRQVGGLVYVLGTVRKRGDYPGTMQTPGLPDLIAFLPQRRSTTPGSIVTPRQLLTVEVKAKGGRLSPAQVTWQRVADEAGVEHVVGGLDAVIAWLTARGYLKGAA
jgi:uncharacterized protein (DUF2342 family)